MIRLSSTAAGLAATLACLVMAGRGVAQPAADGGSREALVPPKLVRLIEADYPPDKLEQREAGTVLLGLAIDATGKVAEATVLESGGEAFDQAALAAVSQFQFEPARANGEPVGVRIQYRYDFKPPEPEQPKPALEFSGTVRDRKTGKPLAGVRLDLDGVQTTTDDQGHFVFSDVPPGLRTLTLSGDTFTPVATQETLELGQRYDANYEVELRAPDGTLQAQVDLEIVIVDQPLRKSIAATTVSAEQGARVAGTGGDVIKVVENLPGVARSSLGSSQLVVWGAAGADTRVYVDDVRVPLLYHEGGYRSVIHSDLVRNVELEPGGYGAPHGRGLGGLVTVGLKPLEADGYHGSLALDAIDAAASMRGSIGDQFRFAGAVRHSHLDFVVEHVATEDVGEFVPIPQYWDAQLRAAWVPREGESLELGGLFSGDQISRTVVDPDPTVSKTDTKDVGFERAYVRYYHLLEDGGSVTITPYFGWDHNKIAQLYGALPAILDTDATLFGLRAAYNSRPVEFISLNVGIDAELVSSSVSRQGSITSPPREGDKRVFGQVPSDQVNADAWTTTEASVAPYAQADIGLFDESLHVIPGIRVEPSIVQASALTPKQGDLPQLGTMREQTLLEPRLAARWSITDWLGLRGAIGLYHQPPLSEDLSAVFGNPQLGNAKAMHYLAGINFKLTETLSIEAIGFYSRQSDLVTRSPLATPREAEALVQEGFGRAYGGQVLLRQELAEGFFGWLSYSLVRSQRKDAGSDEYRLFDFDQTHVLTALASYDLGAGWEVGARFRAATGYPRTPVYGATYDSRTDTFQPVFGDLNTERIPMFYAFDARVTKRFKLGQTSELELYLDVQNVTYHRNAEEVIYNFNYSQKSYITGLPILPVIGAKFTW